MFYCNKSDSFFVVINLIFNFFAFWSLLPGLLPTNKKSTLDETESNTLAPQFSNLLIKFFLDHSKIPVITIFL